MRKKIIIWKKKKTKTQKRLTSPTKDYLGSRGRHLEASQIFIEYSSDVDSAVDTCCRGAEFSEAYRLISIHDRPDLVEAMIHPGLEEAHEALIEVFEEMDGQLDKETKRLKELNEIREKDYGTSDPTFEYIRKKKSSLSPPLKKIDAFYIVEREIDIEGVDVATNATTVASAFTRYTVAPSTMFSQTTRMTGYVLLNPPHPPFCVTLICAETTN